MINKEEIIAIAKARVAKLRNISDPDHDITLEPWWNLQEKYIVDSYDIGLTIEDIKSFLSRNSWFIICTVFFLGMMGIGVYNEIIS